MTYVRLLLPHCALLFTGVIIFVRTLFFTRGHDWDIDAFLYLGSRLWNGELLYLYDFETKFPIVQYLFSAAFALGGIGAWRILSFLAVMGSTAYVLYLQARPGTCGKTAPAENRNLSLVPALWPVMVYMLPGSESGHLEVIAASFALVYLVATSATSISLTDLLVGGMAISIACLIRPNYAFAALLTIPITLFSTFGHGRQSFAALFVFAVGFAVPPLLMVAPYLLVPHGVSGLLEGLVAVATYSSGTPLSKLQSQMFTDRTTFWFFMVLYVACVLSICYLIFGTQSARSVFWKSAALAIAMVGGLHLSHAFTHYWPHNAIMFAPPALVMLQFLTRQVGDRLSLKFGHKALHTAALGAAYLFVSLVVSVEGYSLYRDRALFSWSINSRKVDPRLLQFLQDAKIRNLTFLFVDGMMYHALLNERRVGDGHPFILDRVLSGKKTASLSQIPLFQQAAAEGACEVLINTGKDIIILRNGSAPSKAVFGCLEARRAPYRSMGRSGDYLFLRRY